MAAIAARVVPKRCAETSGATRRSRYTRREHGRARRGARQCVRGAAPGGWRSSTACAARDGPLTPVLGLLLEEGQLLGLTPTHHLERLGGRSEQLVGKLGKPSHRSRPAGSARFSIVAAARQSPGPAPAAWPGPGARSRLRRQMSRSRPRPPSAIRISTMVSSGEGLELDLHAPAGNRDETSGEPSPRLRMITVVSGGSSIVFNTPARPSRRGRSRRGRGPGMGRPSVCARPCVRLRAPDSTRIEAPATFDHLESGCRPARASWHDAHWPQPPLGHSSAAAKANRRVTAPGAGRTDEEVGVQGCAQRAAEKSYRSRLAFDRSRTRARVEPWTAVTRNRRCRDVPEQLRAPRRRLRMRTQNRR